MVIIITFFRNDIINEVGSGIPNEVKKHTLTSGTDLHLGKPRQLYYSGRVSVGSKKSTLLPDKTALLIVIKHV